MWQYRVDWISIISQKVIHLNCARSLSDDVEFYWTQSDSVLTFRPNADVRVWAETNKAVLANEVQTNNSNAKWVRIWNRFRIGNRMQIVSQLNLFSPLVFSFCKSFCVFYLIFSPLLLLLFYMYALTRIPPTHTHGFVALIHSMVLDRFEFCLECFFLVCDTLEGIKAGKKVWSKNKHPILT